MISACVFNARRPTLLQEMVLPALERYASVDEILLFHANADVEFEYESERVAVAHYRDDDSEQATASRRWLGWQYAKHDAVLSLDDDVFCWMASVEALYAAYRRDSDIIHAATGCAVDGDLRLLPREHDVGDALVAHTQSMLLSKRIADACLEWAQANPEPPEPPAPPAPPEPRRAAREMRGLGWPAPNEASIIASLVAIKQSGRANSVLRVPVAPLENLSGEEWTPPSASAVRAELARWSAFLAQTMRRMGVTETARALAPRVAKRRPKPTAKRQLKELAKSAVVVVEAAKVALEARATRRRRLRPRFMILGPERGGTSSLFHYLAQHPRVRLSAKEILHYAFAYGLGEPLHPPPEGRLNYARRSVRYAKKFPRKRLGRAALSGEASPQYFYAPEAPARIRRDYPDMRFIMLLRNPCDRAWALYHMYRSGNVLREHARDREASENFSAALEKERRHRQQGLPMLFSGLRASQLYNHFHRHRASSFPYAGHYGYLSTGAYIFWIKHWLRFFDRSRVLILQSEAMFANPQTATRRVHEFLDLSPEPVRDVSTRNEMPLSYLPLSREMRARLQDYFASPNRRLFDFLGEEFDWA